MQLTKLLAALSAAGFAVAVFGHAPAFAGPSKSPSATQKLAPSGGGRSRAQPGDTCLGISACNTLIVECVLSGHDFKPMEYGPNGEPSYGQCVKRTD